MDMTKCPYSTLSRTAETKDFARLTSHTVRGWTGKNKAFCSPGTRNGHCLIKVYYYAGSQVKVKDTCFIDKKTKADICMATACLNCTLAFISLNYGNLIVINLTLGQIYTSNQTGILTALNNCNFNCNCNKFKTLETVCTSTHSVLSD